MRGLDASFATFMCFVDEDNDLLPAVSNRLRLDAPAANEA
jgi:hypothetical protein